MTDAPNTPNGAKTIVDRLAELEAGLWPVLLDARAARIRAVEPFTQLMIMLREHVRAPDRLGLLHADWTCVPEVDAPYVLRVYQDASAPKFTLRISASDRREITTLKDNLDNIGDLIREIRRGTPTAVAGSGDFTPDAPQPLRGA